KPCEQVEPKCSRTPKQSAPVAGLKPLVLQSKAREREQQNVIVLRHVLRVVQVRRGAQQRQSTSDRFQRRKTEQTKKVKHCECGEHIDEDIRADADEDATDGWVGFRARVVAPERQMVCSGADKIGWKHEQGLPYAVPRVEAPATAMKPKLRILVR